MVTPQQRSMIVRAKAELSWSHLAHTHKLCHLSERQYAANRQLWDHVHRILHKYLDRIAELEWSNYSLVNPGATRIGDDDDD